jgi:hypothetical protein
MVLRPPSALSARLVATAGLLALTFVGPGSGVAARRRDATPGAGLSPSDVWDTFSADVTIRRRLVMANGTAGVEAPAVRYRWTRSARRGGWRSALDLLLPGADRLVLHIEDDEDGTPVRAYDQHGAPIRMASVEDRQVLGEPVPGSLIVPPLPRLLYPDAVRPAAPGRDWVDGFIAVPSRHGRRRAALQARFGRPAGRVRRMDRFVERGSDRTLEVLADAESALPVEINVVRDGALVAHSTLTYAAGRDGTLVRRRIHAERLVSAKTGQRAVADVQLSNVRLERRGRP